MLSLCVPYIFTGCDSWQNTCSPGQILKCLCQLTLVAHRWSLQYSNTGTECLCVFWSLTDTFCISTCLDDSWTLETPARQFICPYERLDIHSEINTWQGYYNIQSGFCVCFYNSVHHLFSCIISYIQFQIRSFHSLIWLKIKKCLFPLYAFSNAFIHGAARCFVSVGINKLYHSFPSNLNSLCSHFWGGDGQPLPAWPQVSAGRHGATLTRARGQQTCVHTQRTQGGGGFHACTQTLMVSTHRQTHSLT